MLIKVVNLYSKRNNDVFEAIMSFPNIRRVDEGFSGHHEDPDRNLHVVEA